MRSTYLLIYLLFCQGQLFSQTLLILDVTDFETGQPIASAFVSPDPLPNQGNDNNLLPKVMVLATTDKNGRYQFDLTEETVQINISHFRYLDTTITADGIARLLSNSSKMARDTVQLAIRMRAVLFPPVTSMPTVVIIPNFDPLGNANQMRGKELQRQTGASLGEFLNRVPGVQFDERGLGGSRRISLRGSMLRSPFGVRNVRVYFNEVPLSSPDGSSPLELIEPRQLGEVKVWKGPQGSWSGPGHGGRIDFSSPSIPMEKIRISGQAGLTMGSFGLFRTYAGLNWRTKKHAQYRIQYTRQQLKGYREQEANQKDQLELHFTLPLNQRHELKLDGWLFDGFWELPGGQTQAAFEANPRAALPYSVTARAAVQRQRARIALGHKWRRGARWQLLSSVYGNLTAKENPYGTSPFFQGYKDESARGMGGRSKFSYYLPRRKYNQWRVDLGGEYQFEDNRLDEFENLAGSPGPLRFAYQTAATHWLAYGELGYQRGKHRLTARLGLDHTSYRFSDLQSSSPAKAFEVAPVLLPDLTYNLVGALRSNWDFVLHIGTGYSPPTVWEMRDQQGSPNLNLKAERSRTIEVKVARTRYPESTHRLEFEMNPFWQQTQDALVPAFTSAGVAYFENVGEINLQGIEWYLSKRLFPANQLGIANIRLWATATTQRASFGAFTAASGENLEDLWVPGLPRLRSNAHIEVNHRKNGSLDLQWSYQGRMPLDETNDNFQAGFSLLHLKIKARFANTTSNPIYPAKTMERFAFSPFIGINNLLDQRYNAFPILNAARDRFFNAGQGRSYYAGLDFRF